MAKLGIDFGSSYCTVSWVNPKNDEITTIKFNGDGSVKVPTLIMAAHDHLEFGFLAEKMLDEVSRMPDNVRMNAMANFIPHIKRKLSPRGIEILNNREYSHLELLQQFFRYLIMEAKRDCGNDYEIDSITISYPVNWERAKIELLCKAFQNIGYPNVETCFEPVAAVKGYCLNHEIKPSDNVLVFDYGGSTTDVTLVKQTGDTLKVILPPEGNSFCGGQDIDALLYEQLRKELLQKKQYDISQNSLTDTILLKSCQRLKEMFNGNNDSYSIQLPLSIGGQLDTYTFELSRSSFNELISPKVTEAIDVAKQVINKATEKHYTINKILMIGGSSNLSIVKEMLSELVKDVNVETSGEKDISVALGNIADYHVALSSPEINDILIEQGQTENPNVSVTPPDKNSGLLEFWSENN